MVQKKKYFKNIEKLETGESRTFSIIYVFALLSTHLVFRFFHLILNLFIKKYMKQFIKGK